MTWQLNWIQHNWIQLIIGIIFPIAVMIAIKSIKASGSLACGQRPLHHRYFRRWCLQGSPEKTVSLTKGTTLPNFYGKTSNRTMMGKLLNGFRVPAKFETLRSFDSCNVSCCAPLLGYADYSGPTSYIFAFKGLIVKAGFTQAGSNCKLDSFKALCVPFRLKRCGTGDVLKILAWATQRLKENVTIYCISWLSNGF